MKTILLAVGVLGVAAAGFGGEEGGVATQVSAVTVYTDRAVVTRTAAVEVAPGTREIVFERLPVSLLDHSLQVSGTGSAAATILDVSARQTHVDFTPNERVRAVEDQLLEVRKQLRALDDRGTTLKEQREFVQRMLTASTGHVIPLGSPGQGGGTPVRPSLEEWQKLFVYSDETFGRIAAEQRAIDEQKNELGTKQSVLQQQLVQLRGAGGKSYKTVTVRVAVANAGELRLGVSYTVPGASWTPAYDARLRTAERSVELSYFGVVRQNTGEDWENVALTLSTARPSLGGGAPELPGWMLRVRESVAVASAMPEPASRAQGQGGGARSFYATGQLTEAAAETFDFGGGPNQALFGTTLPEMVAASGLTSATFRVAAPATLPSDNSTQKVSVTNFKLATKLRYESTPKLREAAFLVAETTNTSEFPMLAGAMNTFLDDVFVAQSAVRTVMPTEKFDLALGADEAISVKRKLVNRFTEATGLTNSGQRVTYDFLVTVTNHKKTAEMVGFKEPVPVSRDEKIVVKILSPLEKDIGKTGQPREAMREGDRLAWKFPLRPGEKREIQVKFSVDYPEGTLVEGLE